MSPLGDDSEYRWELLMSLVVKFTHQVGKTFPVRTFIQGGPVTFKGDLDHVKADDAGLMTDSTNASYDIAYTYRWTGQRWICG